LPALYYKFIAESVLKELKNRPTFGKIMGGINCLKRPVRWGTVLLKDELA